MTEERIEELDAIQAIFPEFISTGTYSGTLEVPVKPIQPLLVRFLPSTINHSDLAAREERVHIEHHILFSVLPPLCMRVELPTGYPELLPPCISVDSVYNWLPNEQRKSLEDKATALWDEYGHGQCLFAYIDHLQSQAEEGFDLGKDGCLILAQQELEDQLITYQTQTKQTEFNRGTYDCSVCLEPKKGTACYQLDKCGHIFCKKCLQDFYNHAIDEGDVAVVRCLNPDCSKDSRSQRKPSLHPRELLAMDIADSTVRRYVEMKRKKRLESDKATVYCPRSWCQGAARSIKYPPIPQDLLEYVEPPEPTEEEHAPASNDSRAGGKTEDDRLTICEKCQFAFCRTCFASWHGSFVRCRPRDPSELTEEEKASYDYIRQHTSPCPTCSSPTQKTMGCNHMHCFQCRTHFCYLCGAWLDGGNPYQHFNTPGRECYQRLWELEEGDEGQAPADGRGFAGARAWEAFAVDAAQQAEEDANIGDALANQRVPVDALEELQDALDQILLAEHEVPLRPQPPPPPPLLHPPPPVHPPRGHNANNPGRGRQRGRGRGVGHGAHNQRPPALAQPPGGLVRRREGGNNQDDELRRFIELAARDEEDGWNSDELTDGDEAWQIR